MGSEKYSEIRKGSYPFQPLETGDKKQSLLEKLTIPLQRMLDDGKQCAVLEPVTRKFFRENLNDVKLHHLHETSKGIDLILARALTINNQQKLYLDLIDVTVQNSSSTIEQKMKHFLQIFLSLKDNDETLIELEVGPKEMRQKMRFPVELRYFIYCQKNQHSTLLDKLKAQFSSQLMFGESEGANYFVVKLKKSQNSLLSAVGFINIESDVTFQSSKKGDKDVLSFRKACQVLNQRRKMKE